jgi:predicted outer membrane repeat protein
MITGNSADLGGGVYCSFSNLADMTITGNTASRQGGGIYFTAGASVFDSISRCNIYFNEAPEGRDLFTNSVIKVIADTFTVLHPTAYYAEPIDKFSFNVLHGKIAQADADVWVSPSGNNANSGLNAGNPLKTMDHAFSIMRADNQHQHSIHLAEGRYCTYTNNEQFPVNIPDYIDIKGANKLNVIFDAVGGARVMNFNNNSSSHVSGITITGGYVAEANGGGVMFNNSSPTMEDMIITGNNAASGGGIFCGYNSNPTLRDIIISDNNAAGSGGGIVCGGNSAPAFINVSILGNSAATGGGIGCFNFTAPVFKNVTITGNLAYDGGGIYCAGNVDLNQMLPVKIENGKISNNFASRGGGVCCDFSKFTGVNLEITDNTATWGGGLYCNISRPVLQNMTLSGNRADSAGGGMYCRSDTRYLISKITNSIVWNNFPQEIYLKPSNAMNAVILSYSDLKGGEGSIVTTGQDTVLWLEGNINQDPLFTGSGAYPYSLQAGSPCRNTGTPDTTGLFLPLTDLAGEPRIWDGRIDMGAYEWNNVGVADLRFTIYDLQISNYPNPFSVITTFSYELTESSKVTLQIYNNLGQLVDELVNTTQPKGDQKVEWNAKNLPAGIYFYLIRAGKQEGNGKMIKL